MGEKRTIENIDDLIDKEIKGNCKTNNPIKHNTRQYKRPWSEIIDDEKFMYSHENIIIPIIMCCRVLTPKAVEFRSELGFKGHDIVLSKEQSVISIIKIIFKWKNTATTQRYFPKHKLAIEVDEKEHSDRDQRKKNEKEEKIKK